MTDYIIKPREESCAICGNPNIYKYDGYCRPLCEKCAKGIVKPYIRNEAKIRRNDPCPCGSGLKYKHCCGK